MKIKTNVGKNFVLPPLYYSFPAAVNPHAEAAEQMRLFIQTHLAPFAYGEQCHLLVQ